ncbi:hypothetical protein [Cohnella soli]|uniref:Uncharacterized protein n=1 Tax=Cohnella soli TaxID=425005 RepID=A0ABW0I2F4_9BACL
MKGIFGAILIYLTYLGAGVFLMGTWPFKFGIEGSAIEVLIVTHLALVMLLYLTSKIINKYKGIPGLLLFFSWYLSSTVYGVIQIKKMFDVYNSDIDGWNHFHRWDFLLWEWSVPVYIGSVQLIIMLCHFFFRILKKQIYSNLEMK